MEGKCPNCGWFPEFPEEDEPFDEIKWAYTKTDDANYMDAIKKSEIRMKKELGYGIPEVTKNDPENLGSCITGIWEDIDENKKR